MFNVLQIGWTKSEGGREKLDPENKWTNWTWAQAVITMYGVICSIIDVTLVRTKLSEIIDKEISELNSNWIIDSLVY